MLEAFPAAEQITAMYIRTSKLSPDMGLPILTLHPWNLMRGCRSKPKEGTSCLSRCCKSVEWRSRSHPHLKPGRLAGRYISRSFVHDAAEKPRAQRQAEESKDDGPRLMRRTSEQGREGAASKYIETETGVISPKARGSCSEPCPNQRTDCCQLCLGAAPEQRGGQRRQEAGRQGVTVTGQPHVSFCTTLQD